MFIFFNFFKILKSYLDNVTVQTCLTLLLILVIFSCNIKTDKSANHIEAKINNSKVDTTQSHQFIARLYEGFNSSVHCGVITTAYAYKFKLIQTDIKNLKDKWIVIIQPCPEFLADDFFKTGKVYKILTGQKDIDYVSNGYEKEGLPTFWSKEISLIN